MKIYIPYLMWCRDGEPLAPLTSAMRRALVIAGLAASPALAQGPPPHGYCAECGNARRVGPIKRMLGHASYTLHDKVIGDPALFYEPPLGYSLNETQAMMVGRAQPHKFTFYRSDFIAGTTELSPSGQRRLAGMARNLSCWVGPVLVEWTPDSPALAESRKAAVVSMLQKSNPILLADRVVISPSPYRGMMGAEAANNFDNFITRHQAAARVYSLTPTSTSDFGGGPR